MERVMSNIRCARYTASIQFASLLLQSPSRVTILKESTKSPALAGWRMKGTGELEAFWDDEPIMNPPLWSFQSTCSKRFVRMETSSFIGGGSGAKPTRVHRLFSW